MDLDTAAKIAAFVSPAISLLIVHFVYRGNKIAQTAARNVDVSMTAAAKAVQNVEKSLATTTSAQDTQLKGISRDASATHKLVNSDRGATLLSNVVLCKHVERLTEDPEEKTRAHEAVVAAETLYKEHQKQQAEVDREKKP